MQTEIIPIGRTSHPGASKMIDHASLVERLNAELSRVIELRRCHELELQTIQARAANQDRLASLGQLAACASHEMNQPLFYLKIFCESIAKNGGTEPLITTAILEEAREACRQIERIQKINRQILRYSRPESESLIPQNVTQAFEHAMALINPQLKRFGVKLSEMRDVEAPFIMGNSGKLEQLFINLLQNAIDALANQGEKKILIRFSRQKGNLVITFRDNGPGVPETIREKIFEPFFTTKACGQGTGLGLTIIADIVRDHQGTIRLNGKRKRGTEFIIQFPALPDHTEKPFLAEVGRQTA